jgi:cysteinyl-tRNA synthetase
MLQVEGKKMSKSLGNFFTVRDLLDRGVPGEVIRFVMLSTHYRKPMDWTEKKAEQAERSLRRWRTLFCDIEPSQPAKEIVNFLSDDLNTAGAVGFLGNMGQVLFQKAGNTWKRGEHQTLAPEWYRLASEFVASARLVGILEPDMGTWMSTPDLHPFARRLAEIRTQALATKDFSEVDRLKEAFVAAGLEVKMSKDGVELTPRPGFDPAKLEALK